MRASAGALPAFEVAIRRRSAALAGAEHVGVHAEAHRAARVAPLETRVTENAVETLALRVRFHAHRSGHDERAQAGADLAATNDFARDAQVLDSDVRARADE